MGTHAFIGIYVVLATLLATMAVVSISLPDPLLRSADDLIENRGFGGRSEFIRACVRDFITQNATRDRPGKRTATLTLVYPEGSEKHFSKLRHEYGDVIRTMIHGHSGGSCMELYVLEADGERIVEFADALRGTRDALQVAMTFTDAWKDAHRARTIHEDDHDREPRSGRARTKHARASRA
jgi:metal-responsive CopG/Arc/MetJ family transcriptional regulator